MTQTKPPHMPMQCMLPASPARKIRKYWSTVRFSRVEAPPLCGYFLNARYATQTKKAIVMTTKIQNAMPSGNVIIDPSGKRDAENVHREFAEQKKQIHQRQRQHQFRCHDCTPLRAGSEIEAWPEPAPVLDAVVQRPDQHDHVDNQEPTVDSAVPGLDVSAAVFLGLLVMG
jgi:hypothetical protein